MSSTLPQSIEDVLTLLCIHYPYWLKERSGHFETIFGLYRRLLADIPLQVLNAAALQHIAQSRYFPTIAELREIAFAITRPQKLTALEAWHSRDDELAQEIKRMLPNYNSPTITMKEQSIIRSQFIKTYEQMAKREEQESHLLPELQHLRATLLLEGPTEEEE